jgi:hypothetical protein
MAALTRFAPPSRRTLLFDSPFPGGKIGEEVDNDVRPHLLCDH